MSEPKVATNSTGYIQYFDGEGNEVCPACGKQYHNEGNGLVCCDDGKDAKVTQARSSVVQMMTGKFLSTPNHSQDGGWPNITREEEDEFFTLLYTMIEAKWGRDCDGDLPIRIHTEVRNQERLAWSIPTRSTYRLDGEELENQLMTNLHTVSCAISAYNDELRQIVYQLQHVRTIKQRKAGR